MVADLTGVGLPALDIAAAGARVDLRTGDQSFAFSRVGDSISGRWFVHSDSVTWSRHGDSAAAPAASAPPSGARPGWTRWCGAPISSLKDVEIEARIHGRFASPAFDVSSNIGGAVSRALGQAVAAEVRRAETAVRAKVDSLVGQQVERGEGETRGTRYRAPQGPDGRSVAAGCGAGPARTATPWADAWRHPTALRLLLLSNSKNHGGQYLGHAEAEIKDFLGKRVEKVLFVPYAAVRVTWDDFAATVRKRFADLGYGLESVHEAADPVAAALHAEAIVVGGGNTWHLLDALYRTKVLEAIRERARAGAPYIGWSAGSNIAGLTIKTTNDMPIVLPPRVDALALLPFQLNPHYTDEVIPNHAGETRAERLLEFIAANPGVPSRGVEGREHPAGGGLPAHAPRRETRASLRQRQGAGRVRAG